MAQRVRDPLSGPGVTRVTPAPPVVYDAFGRQYQAPVPPRLDRSRAGVIYRDLPVVTTGLDWLQGDDPVTAVREALEAHMAGQFSASALLWDAMSGDDRIHASLGSRVGALFGLPTIIECEDEAIRAEWTKAWEAAAPPAGAPMAPQVPVAEVITRTVAGIRAMRNGGVPHRCARRTG